MSKIQELNQSMKEFIVERVIQQVREQYVFPEVAEKIVASLEKSLHEGAYHSITNIEEFCEEVSNELLSISQDKHLRVIYRPEIPSEETTSIQERMVEEERRRGQVQNYGIHKVERLPGNIGYMDIRQFYSVDIGAETVIAAMNMIANTDVLLIDLRKNGGGRVEMVTFLSSYLFEESTHINSVYSRSDNSLIQAWTQRDVPGKKYIDKPLYILTSGFTFSGGEAFAYSLQQAQKAKVIGEITGGGAHPVTFQQISENIRFRIPNRRSINPITLSNWEGTGVIPDVQLEQEKAFDYAYTEALHIVREKYKDKPHYAFLVTEIDSVLETR